MDRKEFMKICGILGIGTSIQTSVMSCSKDNNMNNFSGKVIIIGAGAGGLSSGYLLQQQGIDFEILEASPVYGGRMKVDTNFADFPIPLGAEWLETNTGIFEEIVNDSKVQVNVETIPDGDDRKFINYSWFDFYEEFVVPSIAHKIVYSSVVQSIDYSGSKAIITTQTGQYEADKVIISVPLKILQDGDINFSPSLPQEKIEAINNTRIWEGFKAFIEFSTNFYEDGHIFQITPETEGQKLYYNAAFGQNTTKNILGLFTVGTPAQDYIARSGNELRDFMLNELDGIFSNQASTKYIKHITQNWNNESFIKAGYMSDHADSQSVRKLGESVDNKIYFSGGAYTDGSDWVSVHAAAQSAKRAVGEII